MRIIKIPLLYSGVCPLHTQLFIFWFQLSLRSNLTYIRSHHLLCNQSFLVSMKSALWQFLHWYAVVLVTKSEEYTTKPIPTSFLIVIFSSSSHMTLPTPNTNMNYQPSHKKVPHDFVFSVTRAFLKVTIAVILLISCRYIWIALFIFGIPLRWRIDS